MMRIKNSMNLDRISVGLLAVAVVSSLAARTVTTASASSAVPEHVLDSLRGANQAWYRAVNPTLPNCTALEVYDLTSAGYTVVPFSGCNVGNINTMCVQCANVPNYQLNATPGAPLAIIKPIGASNCNGTSGSSSGTCQLIGFNNPVPGCQLTNGYDCDQYAFFYNLEPQ